MKLTFIGTGSAFTVGQDNYHSNMIVESSSHQTLLIDCGSDARLALHEINKSYRDIDAIYISHLHADHCGGLEWLAFCTKYDPQCSKPTLFIHPDLIEDLWRMLSISLNPFDDLTISLETYFEVHEIQNNRFLWDQHQCQIFQTYHITQGNQVMPSYGIMLEGDEKTVMITADTQFTPELLMPLFNQADIIFHDCDIGKDKSKVHAHYDDLRQLDSEVKGKMWLYHYLPMPLPNACSEGFRGFVKKGQSFEF